MKYKVIFAPFTERHFIRSFAKKYQNAWERTQKGLELEFSYIDTLFTTNIAETISLSPDNDLKICKTEFKIVGTSVSRHASGNRCIIAVCESTTSVHVLLVYGKGDIGSNETAKWKSLVKENYPEYAGLM